ncbi:unnamed protein product, partial [Rotaria sordida]
IVLSKHRVVFKIYNQNKLVKDEFLGMVFVDLNLNISYESAEQSIVLQHVRDIATIGLVYINPVDDIDSNNSQPNASTNLWSAIATTVISSYDALGPLPFDWQMFKMENGRMFFIDHANKRTTWIDPRSGKPSPSSDAQHELNQNGPLPVSKTK